MPLGKITILDWEGISFLALYGPSQWLSFHYLQVFYKGLKPSVIRYCRGDASCLLFKLTAFIAERPQA